MHAFWWFIFSSLLLLGKTPSILTLDSIDDFARYSDDGMRETDEKVTGTF